MSIETGEVHTYIEKDTFQTITFSTKSDRKIIEAKYSQVSVFNSSKDYNFANNLSGTTKEMKEGKKCYLRTITDVDSNLTKDFKRNLKDKFYTSNGEGMLKFYSPKTGKLSSVNFKVESFLQGDNKPCT